MTILHSTRKHCLGAVRTFALHAYVSSVYTLCSFLALLLVVGCESSIFDPPVQEIPTGEYRGSYSLTRLNPTDKNAKGTNYAEASMALVLNTTNRTYKVIPLGDSATPPASEGTYSLRYTRITFRDRSSTIFSDPSLVINGEFTYTFDGSSLVLSQNDSTRRREHSAFLTRF
jgi:hypothetical protein